MKIFGQTLDTSILDTIREEAASAVSRSSLARKVCEFLGWKGANGKPKEMNARLLLNKLERTGEVVLPPSRGPVPGWRPPEETDPLWQTMAEPFDGALSELGPLEIVRVATKEESRLWNALFSRYHYLGKGPLCGAQIRYLAKSPVLGVVGGAAFSSASWKVAARDLWIGWNEEGRQKNLGKVVNNSRFLILPHIRVPPSGPRHLLGRLLRRLPSDWERLYGERPVLVETFVERERFAGTSYRAANFTEIGPTSGLGRKGLGTSVKTVYAYPLVPDFRERLRAGQTEAAPPVAPVFSDWTEEEFGGVDLGDARLGARCRILAQDFYARPQASIPQSCGGDRAKAKAAYRFFDHERATLDVLLEPHQKATIERMKAHPVVLCPQDTTELDYSGHPDTEGLGPIGNHKGGAQGLLLHDTVAFTPDGTPLGVVQAQTWVRPKEKPAPPPPKKRGRKPRNAPPEPPALPDPKSESEKWLASYREVARIQALLPGTRLVSVGDRESDFYELFALATRGSQGAPTSCPGREGPEDDREHGAVGEPQKTTRLRDDRGRDPPEGRTAGENGEARRALRKLRTRPSDARKVQGSGSRASSGGGRHRDRLFRRHRAARMEASDDRAGRFPREGGGGGRLVCETMGDRGLSSDAQVRVPHRRSSAGQRPSSRSLPGDRHGGGVATLPSDKAGTGDPRCPLYGLLRGGRVEGPVHLPHQESRASGDAAHAWGGDPDDGEDRRVPRAQGGWGTRDRSALEGAPGSRENCRILGNS
ncbi:MAG: hypothetical protein D084_Lepto4C00527G0002 [Leptospirillum sp. Group IV 'UBA BS']|nr:MAG: hypothetical protein D084_Lepto4C00527G0002 [Leptospirillum sp. Group IV 'UBA BS']